jgi:hypothetical protein
MYSTYQNKKNGFINIYLETFDLWVLAEEMWYMHDGALACFMQDVLNSTDE